MKPKINYEQRFYEALKRISQYQTPATLERQAAKDWGLDDWKEAMEYAYENVLGEAKAAIKGYRRPKESRAALQHEAKP